MGQFYQSSWEWLWTKKGFKHRMGKNLLRVLERNCQHQEPKESVWAPWRQLTNPQGICQGFLSWRKRRLSLGKPRANSTSAWGKHNCTGLEDVLCPENYDLCGVDAWAWKQWEQGTHMDQSQVGRAPERDFPGRPVVRTLHFQRRGREFDPRLIPCSPANKLKKKKKKKKNS